MLCELINLIWDNSKEYTQNTIILKKIKKTSPKHHHFCLLTLLYDWPSVAQTTCLEQISMVQKMFEPLVWL